MRSVTRKARLLVNEGKNCSADQVPVLVQSKGYDWLNVGCVPHGIGWSDPKVPVVLDRNANQAGDRVQRFLDQFRLLGLLVGHGLFSLGTGLGVDAERGNPG